MKILVVEDDKKIARFIKAGLEREGYEVDVDHLGEEGSRRILEGSYGLVILDVVLEKNDGLSLVRSLRAEKILVPVMLLTAKDTVEDIVAGFDAGADDYLAKPFAFAEFLARIRALQRRAEQDRGATICIGDLFLDPVTHQVRRNGKLINLCAKEYELLEFFVRNSNQVLSRKIIADAIWDGGVDKFSNVVDVFVSFLRKKINRNTDKQLIHTVRGIGYILKEVGEGDFLQSVEYGE